MKGRIKVIIMVSSPLTARWESYFCVDALSKDFDLEYWDLSPLAGLSFEAKEQLSRDYTKTIDSMQTLEKELSKLPKDAVCLSHIHLEDTRNYPIHKLISSYCKSRVGVNFWACAYTENIDFAMVGDKKEEEKKPSKSTLREIKRFLYQSRTIAYIAKYIWHHKDGKFEAWKNTPRGAEINWPLYNHYTIDVMPGSPYFLNHPDYEKYLQIRDSKEGRLVEGKYIVYVDQYFLFHPTVELDNPGVDFESLRKTYYQSLNRFFDVIEQKYDVRVVIAAHPVANYQENLFNGREVIYFKTAELIRDCEAVCLHNSCSISFAILFDKPICIIHNNQHDAVPEMKQLTLSYSKLFHLPLVNMDEPGGADIFTRLQPNVRDGFIKTFYDVSMKKTNKELYKVNIERIHEDIVANLEKQSIQA